jgi:hypothetical protein
VISIRIEQSRLPGPRLPFLWSAVILPSNDSIASLYCLLLSQATGLKEVMITSPA